MAGSPHLLWQKFLANISAFSRGESQNDLTALLRGLFFPGGPEEEARTVTSWVTTSVQEEGC